MQQAAEYVVRRTAADSAADCCRQTIWYTRVYLNNILSFFSKKNNNIRPTDADEAAAAAAAVVGGGVFFFRVPFLAIFLWIFNGQVALDNFKIIF